MEEREDHKGERHIYYALIALGAVLVVLFVFFVGQYRALRHTQILEAHEARLSAILSHHVPLPTSEANTIHSWMTFDYVDKLFALPSNYLETQLSINNSHYPRLTISSYATAEHIDQTTFLVSVENAVRGYASSTPEHVVSTTATQTI